MSFENLSIGRLIIHEIFARGADKALVPPNYGGQLLELPQDARDALQARITNALGKSSHGVEMSIRDNGADSTWNRAKEIVEAQGNDVRFVNLSQNIASKLAVAQSNRTIPGGIVVVIEGTCGNPSRSFMCVIKAEPHGGFTKRQAGQNLTLEYIKDLILTPQAKLYKIGAFLRADQAAATVQQPTNGWKAFLFDDLITQGNKLSAAQYFYESFLGLEFPSNSAFQTKQFHALTKDFIRNANVDTEKKIDLLNALTTYLKTDQSATIQVDAFSQNYLGDAALQDAYTAYMEQKNFPETAIHKDLSEVQSQLRLRKLTFGHDIKLTAPADQFENYVRIETIDGDADEHGNVPKWTKITVRDHIRDQE
ncbi:nucleoid-associated protein [Variovorax sp. LT1R16]|uniref:nucleoid-associated protein n=1 Tax=Variovorax sp. LT1R16 TaxID=3443728 RepID=UPI003F46ADB0